MRLILTALLLGSAVPVVAQTVPATAQAPAADPARLAAAQQLMRVMWPDGMLATIMQKTMGMGGGGAMDAMFDLKASDFDGTGKAGDETLGQMMAKGDPHFRERMQIMSRVMSGEMAEMMRPEEPNMRDAMAKAYAERFTVKEIGEMHAFFSTPTGRKIMLESYTIASDPAFMQVMMRMSAALAKRMPEIMKKVEAASKHLPPPPKAAAAEAEGAAPADETE